MEHITAKPRPWLGAALLCLAAGQQASLADTADFATPPQHRSARSDLGDATPMTVVPSLGGTLGRGWHWVPIDGATCRDGSHTGIAVRLRPASDTVMVVLQGGGACYSLLSCLANPPRYGLEDFQAATSKPSGKEKLFQGIWQLSSPLPTAAAPVPNADVPNLLADTATQVFVPYCSGDLHVGARQDARVSWLMPPQNFQGARNTDLAYRYVVSQLLPLHRPPRLHLVLAGYSAGGYGATLTAGRLRGLLPQHVRMTLVTDAAPLFEQTTTQRIPAAHMLLHGTVDAPDQTLFRPCMQRRFHDAWNLSRTVIAHCGAACTPGNWMNPSFQKLLVDHRDVPVGITVPTYDSVLRGFMGFMQDVHCAWNPTEAQFLEGLTKLRAQMQRERGAQGNATYFVSTDKTTHVALRDRRYFELLQATASAPAQAPVRLQDWLEQLVSRPLEMPPGLPAHVGP